MPLGAPFSLVYAPGKSIYRRDAEFAEGIMGLVEYGGRSGRWFVHRVLARCYFGVSIILVRRYFGLQQRARGQECPRHTGLRRQWLGKGIGDWGFGADWDGASGFV